MPATTPATMGMMSGSVGHSETERTCRKHMTLITEAIRKEAAWSVTQEKKKTTFVVRRNKQTQFCDSFILHVFVYQTNSWWMKHSCRTRFLHHWDLLGLITDAVGVVHPAVVLISPFAVSQWEALVGRLGKILALLHLDQLEVIAFLLTLLLLGTGIKRSALHTVSEKIHRGGWYNLHVVSQIKYVWLFNPSNGNPRFGCA